LQNAEPKGASTVERCLHSVVINISHDRTCTYSIKGDYQFRLHPAFELSYKKAIDRFLLRTNDLCKYQLTTAEWDILKVYSKILAVILCLYLYWL
jgi:hypothetical protein